jgi:hypothetical protein
VRSARRKDSQGFGFGDSIPAFVHTQLLVHVGRVAFHREVNELLCFLLSHLGGFACCAIEFLLFSSVWY